ncbi:SMI1/KNR4 family protein [Dactylosporangium sp. CA-152071]|uniref:SMI1/KNR4 family protein n=1 Tax=Dactylosporangium sp. CA-152071 TaxID=3239933 RepID=UPI003D91FAF1
MVDDEIVAAWRRIEAALGRVLPAALELLPGPADGAAVEAVEAALRVALPEDFKASLLVHNGTTWGMPSPMPLYQLYGTDDLVGQTREWWDCADPDPELDEPGAWAYHIDEGSLHLSGAVRPVVGGERTVLVGDLNGDVLWYLDLDPAPGGTVGQVVRVDVECAMWDVLAPSWRQLLLDYAAELERTAAGEPTTLDIDARTGPTCDWGVTDRRNGHRPAWLQGVAAREPNA